MRPLRAPPRIKRAEGFLTPLRSVRNDRRGLGGGFGRGNFGRAGRTGRASGRGILERLQAGAKDFDEEIEEFAGAAAVGVFVWIVLRDIETEQVLVLDEL